MSDEKRYCRTCGRELEIVPEEQDDENQYVPLYYCEHCRKLYRFVEVD